MTKFSYVLTFWTSLTSGMSSEAEVSVLVPIVLAVSTLALQLSEWTRCILVAFPLWAQENSWTVRAKVTYVNRN